MKLAITTSCVYIHVLCMFSAKMSEMHSEPDSNTNTNCNLVLDEMVLVCFYSDECAVTVIFRSFL